MQCILRMRSSLFCIRRWKLNANGKNECFTVVRIRNIAGREKTVHARTSGGTASGASEENASAEIWGKWVGDGEV